MANVVWTEADLNEAIAVKASTPTAAAPIWRYAGLFFSGAAVANYVNAAPAQHAGEVVVCGDSNGPFQVWVYF
jgi:hypothetical protein